MTGTGPEPLPAEESSLEQGRPSRPAWVRRVIVLVVMVVVTVVVFRLVGAIDWAAVGDALRQLSWWQLAVLFVLLVVRQLLNSMPLALYTPGIGIPRAAMNDMGAMVTSCVAPPPSDIALRISMFKSWGVPSTMGMAGTVLNMVTFYIIRFATPAVGFVVLVATGKPPGIRLLDLVFVAASVVLLVGLLLVVRSDPLARWIGSRAGRMVHGVRRRVDPARWASSCASFRDEVADPFYGAFPNALASQAAMIATDLAMVTLCLRFVGVGADEVGFDVIAIAYLFAYPMTLLVFSGLGVVDALIVAALVEAGGPEVESAAVAALIVWRIFTVAGPIVMGAVSIGLWRRSVASSTRPADAG